MQREIESSRYTKQKVDRFHALVVDELIRHGKMVFGPEAFAEAVDEFFGWPEEDEEIDLDYQVALFYPWFLFKWMIQSVDGKRSLPGPRDLSIVHSYLQSRSKKLDTLEREYLENFAKAPFTFFEITAVKPGKSIDLRDLLLERDHHQVLENTASQTLNKGDVIFGSAFEAGGIGLLGAVSMVTFRPSAKVEILALKEVMSQPPGSLLTAATLEEYDIELRDLYFDLFYEETNMPGLCNSDGEELAFHTLEYAITSPQKVFDALKGLSHDFVDEKELLQEAIYDQQGALCKVELPWILPANGRHGSMDNTVHGHLTIDGLRLSCEVNSSKRAKRLRAIIEKALPNGEAIYQTTVVQSSEDMMRARTLALAEEEAEREELRNDPAVKAHIEEFMRKHWESWPDLGLPALQGKTPRQAVQDELGRQQVNALLEDAERGCRTNNGALGSIENLLWVRRILGLEKSLLP